MGDGVRGGFGGVLLLGAGGKKKEQCGEPNRLLIRNASNAYFPQLLSVISLPDRDDRIKQAVDSIWDTLEAVENLDQLRYERRKAKVKAALEDLTDEEVLADIQSRSTGSGEPHSCLRGDSDKRIGFQRSRFPRAHRCKVRVPLCRHTWIGLSAGSSGAARVPGRSPHRIRNMRTH